MSRISPRSPTAAKAVPRLIAVVVLPTPPFWFEIESTRRAGYDRWSDAGSDTCEPPQFDDTAMVGTETRPEFRLERPISCGLRQFNLNILTLQEKGHDVL